MKKAAMILAIIGGLLGFFGGIVTLSCAGCGESVRQVNTYKNTESSKNIEDSAYSTVAKLGVTGMISSLLSIVFGIIGGVSEKKNTIKLMSLLLLIAGLVSFVASNYFSGPLLVIGGILGLIGSKQVQENPQVNA